VSSADPFADLVDPFSGRKAESSDGKGRASPTAGLDPYTQLKGIPIFGQLSLPDMKDLFRVCGAMQWAAGTVLIEQGETGKGLIVITEGQVQVMRTDRGTSKVLATLPTGSYVGEISLVDDAPTSARVVAAGAVRGLVITPERFQQYLYTHEAAALRIYALFTRTLAARLRQANERQ
jgi:CRP-like cAMP-binding protein